MVWLVVFTEYQLHLRSEALRSCSEGQNFLFPCWNSILSFLLQMFRLTRPPEAQIRTNLRPSVASVGLSFLGITLWNIPPHDLSGHETEEQIAGRVEEHDVDITVDTESGGSKDLSPVIVKIIKVTKPQNQ